MMMMMTMTMTTRPCAGPPLSSLSLSEPLKYPKNQAVSPGGRRAGGAPGTSKIPRARLIAPCHPSNSPCTIHCAASQGISPKKTRPSNPPPPFPPP